MKRVSTSWEMLRFIWAIWLASVETRLEGQAIAAPDATGA